MTGKAAYTHHQRAQHRTVATKIVAKFERDDRELAARSAEGAADRREALTRRSSEYSDPTAAAAVRGAGQVDDATRALGLFHDAVKLLEQADSYRARALPPVRTERPTDWCTSCERAGVLSPRGTEKEVGKSSSLCGWCHVWQREHSQLPPVVLIEKRARGERIYDRDITAALGTHPPRRPPPAAAPTPKPTTNGHGTITAPTRRGWLIDLAVRCDGTEPRATWEAIVDAIIAGATETDVAKRLETDPARVGELVARLKGWVREHRDEAPSPRGQA